MVYPYLRFQCLQPIRDSGEFIATERVNQENLGRPDPGRGGGPWYRRWPRLRMLQSFVLAVGSFYLSISDGSSGKDRQKEIPIPSKCSRAQSRLLTVLAVG
jgi:hypothetical protein